MTAAMRAGHEAYVAKQRRAAVDRVALAKGWNASSARVTAAERAYGANSPQHIAEKERHANAWHGVTFPLPSDNDYAVYREALAA